ncbi:caspase family protein [Plantactinospora sp. KLBMP9567]|uniref:wHTH domain-containing protein n=1 Tax=Plantactinospora sp. KLBMP9567 TaxID=3085900 RepID=UPI002981167D|nr:caspase family protein [Plantactinospora sp. KLBMP9567]MDW5322522.1 caspase family protein [Plantactinospora sp. KLBMP9567]
MTDRHALLIGVPACDSDLFPPIRDVVANDIDRMTTALGQSGYQVRHCGVGGDVEREPTGSRIRAAVLRACQEAPPGGVLLLYFSGHGVVIDGQSYLAPCDAYPEPGGQRPDRDGLVPLVPRYLEHCRARLVVFFVDACREDPAGPLGSTPQGGLLPYPAGGDFALVNSCRPGQRSRYADTGSFFTQVLAEALDRRSPARTLDEVYAEVERQMARRAARIDGVEQVPEIVWARHGAGTGVRGDVVICEGDQVSEAWRRAVADTPLWDRCRVGTDPERIRAAVTGVVEECARRWGEAQEALAERAGVRDPWSTQDYPVRVLAAVESFVTAPAGLTPEEVGILAAVPFLREAAIAGGLREAAAIAPTDFSRTYRDGPRADLEITHAMHEHVCRRAEGLARRDRPEARDALAMWLVHRWLGDRLRLWESAAATAVCRRLAATLASGPTGTMTESELCSVLRALMHGVGADPDDRRLVERLNRPDFDARFRSLAVALWLAGIVAADPRRMPTVVVDHVGIGAELPLSALLAAMARLDWRRGADVLHLHAVCDHPAMHDAFSEVAMRAERARETTRDLAVADELLGNLPARFDAAGLRPEHHHDGTPAYETPLLRFRLSDEKIRELLMGRQLYGEPALAIRELYQNALDACRYRHVRRRYRERIGRPTAPWTGLITFRQGRDTADGREYVECVDNGVGMTVEALKNTFANAGERFVYRQGFRHEQARWQDLDPPLRLVPNSQFGVGVFSYFMIADEIQIVTRPVGEDDLVAPQAHSVRIASSGSLFQITTAPDELPTGGTRVRLYLTGEERISVLRTMRRLLWLAEFRVEVAEDGAGHETWQEEELRYPDATAAPLKYGADLWWVSGEGGLAADGIQTNEETHGFVVNLRDVRRPQFTVDRNTLRNWDKAWVRDQIRASLPELARWPGLNLSWFWEVTRSTPSVAQDVFSYLAGVDQELPVEGPWGHGVSVPIRRVGCLPVDLDLFTGEGAWWIGQDQAWLRAWRFGVWRGSAPSLGEDFVPAVVHTDGLPTVEPFDADMLESLYRGNYRDPARYGRPTADTLLELAAHEEHRGTERLRRLRRFAIVGLDLSAARVIPPLARTFEPDDQVLVLALAAWAPPGEPPRSAVGGWLGRVSTGLHIPLDEVLRRAGQLVPPGWSPPAGDLAALRDHVFNQAELNLFSQDLDGGPPWIGPSVSPAHVLRASSNLGRPVDQVLALFDKFAPLGYTVAGRDRYPDELTTLEREALRHVHTVGQRLTPLHLLVLSARTGTSTGQIHRDLTRLAGTGLLRLPDMNAYPDFTPTDAERAFAVDDLQWYDPVTASYTLHTGWQALRAIAREIGSRDFAGFDERLARFRRLLDIVDPGGPVTVPHLVDLAYYLDCGIGAVTEYLRTLLPDTIDLSQLPTEALTSVATCHHWEERLALIGPWHRTSEPDAEPSWQLGAGDIVVAASSARQSVGEFLDDLEPYRALGAPLPELDKATLAAFRDLVPDRYDRALLTRIDQHGQEFYRDTVDALELIQVAGRFGWTVAYAHQRLARFVPLGVTLDYPVDACPDDLVHWQDLLVVTRYLDGQAPALCGTVGPAHVAAAADEVGESTGQVRARLRRYAALLGFQVDEPGTRDEEEVQGDGTPHRAPSPGRVPTG